jgi:hypothetical protein
MAYWRVAVSFTSAVLPKICALAGVVGRVYTVSVSDTALALDYASKSPAVLRADSSRAVEAFSKYSSFYRPVVDSSRSVDLFSKAPAKLVAEASRPLDYVCRSPLKALLDSSRPLEAFSKTCVYYRLLADLSRPVDYLTRSPLKKLVDLSRSLELLSKYSSLYRAVGDVGRLLEYPAKSISTLILDRVFGDFEYLALRGKGLRDSLVGLDYTSRAPCKAAVERGVSVDLLSKAPSKVAGDAGRWLDYLSKSPSVLEVDAGRLRDALSSLTGKALVDASRLLDYLYRAVAKPLTEVVTTIDYVEALKAIYITLRDYLVGEYGVSKSGARALLDVPRVVEYSYKAASRGLRDASRLVDYYSRALSKLLVDSAKSLEYVARLASKSLLERGGALEYLLTVKELHRSLADYLASRDYLAKALSMRVADAAASLDFVSVLKAVVVALRDYIIGEFELSKAPGRGVVDAGRAVDVVAKVAYTLADLWARRVYLLPPTYRALWDLIASSDHNTKVDICKRLLERFKDVRAKIGLESATADSLISELEGLVSSMRYVKPGDEVRAEDTNLFVRYAKRALELLKELYELYKVKMGKALPSVEVYVSSAELRAMYLREVRSMELVHPDHHNLVVDTLKYVEMALREIDRNLY